MLRLQAKGSALLVGVSTLPDDGSIEKIAGIELNCRFGRKDFHHSPAVGLAYPGGQRQALVFAVDYKGVIVSTPQLQLLIIVIDARADGRGPSEIQGRALDRAQFSGRNQGRVNRRETVGVDHELVPQNVAAAFAGQVEVAVMGKIEGCGFVGDGMLVQNELILIGQGVSDLDLEVAGIAFFAIRAGASQRHTGCLRVLERFRLPHYLVEPDSPTVQ